MYINVNNTNGVAVTRYLSMFQNAYSSQNYYGYIVLVDEDALTADFIETTMFKIADNVPT